MTVSCAVLTTRTIPMPDDLTAEEREAMMAARKRELSDPSVSAFEAGWNAARSFYTESSQQAEGEREIQRAVYAAIHHERRHGMEKHPALLAGRVVDILAGRTPVAAEDEPAPDQFASPESSQQDVGEHGKPLYQRRADFQFPSAEAPFPFPQQAEQPKGEGEGLIQRIRAENKKLIELAPTLDLLERWKASTEHTFTDATLIADTDAILSERGRSR